MIAPAWAEWLAENALRGAPPAALVDGLAAGGLPRREAEDEVAAALASPALAAARRLVGRRAGLEQVARLRRRVDPGPVTELDTLDERLLEHGFWRANRPVVLRGAARGWPACAWTWEVLAARFGAIEVDVLVGRADRWWRDRERITRRWPFAELVARCLGAPGDEVYADGRTNLLDSLPRLRDDLGLLPGLVGDGAPRLWVGPAGTVTPTHHDQSTAWFVQLVGSKRVWLASSLEPALLSAAEGVYAGVDPREPATGELGEVAWSTFDLHAGDAVLLPVGWWHQLVALSPSISASFGGFRWPNAEPWYTPGRAGAPPGR